MRRDMKVSERIADLSPADAEAAANGLGYSVTSRREGHPEEILQRVRLHEIRGAIGELAMWKVSNPVGGVLAVGDDVRKMLEDVCSQSAYDVDDIEAAISRARSRDEASPSP